MIKARKSAEEFINSMTTQHLLCCCVSTRSDWLRPEVSRLVLISLIDQNLGHFALGEQLHFGLVF